MELFGKIQATAVSLVEEIFSLTSLLSDYVVTYTLKNKFEVNILFSTLERNCKCVIFKIQI